MVKNRKESLSWLHSWLLIFQNQCGRCRNQQKNFVIWEEISSQLVIVTFLNVTQHCTKHGSAVCPEQVGWSASLLKDCNPCVSHFWRSCHSPRTEWWWSCGSLQEHCQWSVQWHQGNPAVSMTHRSGDYRINSTSLECVLLFFPFRFLFLITKIHLLEMWTTSSTSLTCRWACRWSAI